MKPEKKPVRTDASAIEQALIAGDLSRLTPEQRLSYYKRVCESLGLNPLTKPFEYIRLNGRLVLYARRDAADQLRKLHGISIEIVSQKREGDLYIVHVRARDREGRVDEELGVVPIGGLKGDALANAILKAITKAKRRVTLSLAGLGWLDETEVETIPDAEHIQEGRAEEKVDPGPSPDATGHLRLLRDLDRALEAHGITGREQKLAWCSYMLGREITSARDLSADEARRLIDALAASDSIEIEPADLEDEA